MVPRLPSGLDAASSGLGSFRACRWILSPSFVLVPVRVGGLFAIYIFYACPAPAKGEGNQI